MYCHCGEGIGCDRILGVTYISDSAVRTAHSCGLQAAV
jgi:hypothetical protein